MRELWGSKISPPVHCLRQFYAWIHIQLSFLRTSTWFTPSVRKLLHSQNITIYINIWNGLSRTISTWSHQVFQFCCYVSHKVSHITQFCYVFIGPRSSSLTTNSLRMSASAHETLVAQKSIMSVSAHETQVQSELQPYYISSQVGLPSLSRVFLFLVTSLLYRSILWASLLHVVIDALW